MRTRDGKVLNEDDLDRLVDEAEAGYDLTSWVRRPGRPAIDAGHQGELPKIETRIPAAVRTDLVRFAAEDGTTISAVLRGLVERYVTERRARTRPEGTDARGDR